jgi:hypothetical protein
LKEKSFCYFQKKIKNLKKPKKTQKKPLLVGFFRWVFLVFFGWVFLGGFFNANPGHRVVAYRLASLCSPVGRYDKRQPYAGVNFIPLVRDYKFGYWSRTEQKL